jgi:uncharacterized protein
MAVLLILAGAACKDKDPSPLEYDRELLTLNLADNLIVPAYSEFSDAANSLQGVQRGFRAQPSLNSLSSFRLSFQNAWTRWKACSAFEFGPAAAVSLRTAINTFPTDTAQIWGNVNAGTWDLNQASNIDARGFPAIDYLLFGLGSSDSAVVTRFLAPADSAQLQRYLAALVGDVQALTAGVYGQWTGGYAQTFKAGLGTDVGGSTSLVVNEVNRDLELIKQASLGIPIGKESFGTPLPDKVEALYSGWSLILAQSQLAGVMSAFWGHAANKPDGYGLDDALVAMNATYGSGSLIDAIRAQSDAASAALSAIPDPLHDAVLSNPAVVEAAHTQIQKLVVLLKADMASTLGILISYVDNDGD